MKYHFSLDGKALAVVAAGLCVAGTLVFASGFLTGVGLRLPDLPPAQFMVKTPAAPPAAAKLKPLAAPATAAVATPAPAAAPSSTTAAAPAATATAAAPALAANGTAANDTANSAPDACGAAAAPTATATLASPEFAIQLGAFLDAANASRLATALKGRGCTATVYQITDEQNRTWTVVRIGQFSSLQDAVRAASNFKRSQGMLALVRPAGSL
ncbi:MAG TPA: SPOR domain-containing protein [Terriglobales bacterium]|jgi:cell division septation protein DedD